MNKANVCFGLQEGDFSDLAKTGPIKLLGGRLCFGAAVPSGVAGYPFGAFFVHTDGSGEADAVYVNIGDIASCNFNPPNMQSAAQTFKAGAAAAAVALRFGKTVTEGLEIKVIDETVTLTNAVEDDLTETVPAGAVILSSQGNLETAVVGDGTGDDGLVKVGIGVTADPNKYGLSGALTKNSKIDSIPDWAVLGSEETVTVKAADAAGAAVTEKFTAGGSVRVRIVYAVCNSLDNAA